MKALAIVAAVQNKKGQHVLAVWERFAKTLKTSSVVIGKRTSAYVRAGINYANLGVVKDGIAAGERGEVESLPWGQWRAGFETMIIDHKDCEYVRLYPATFDNLVPTVQWFMNGQPATYEQVEPHLLASEKRKDDDDKPLCFTLKAETVLEIAGE